VPLIPHAIGGMFFTAIDRFFLTNYVGLAQTGNYSVAYQLGAILSLITTAFNNAYVPWLFNNLNKDDLAIKRKIVKFTYLYYLVLIIGAMLLISLFPIVIRIFVGGAFKNIGSYSTFIVLAFVFQGMYFMVTNYIAYSQKTYLQAIITISVGLLKIPITYFAIVLWGASGASISFFVTFFIFFVATWILSSRVYKMPWIAVLKSKKRDN
jgi:O-antigen/teichoic acid export membrane protein